LTDGEWRRIEPLIPGKKGDKGRHGADNRLFVDAVSNASYDGQRKASGSVFSPGWAKILISNT
jgi:transposase